MWDFLYGDDTIHKKKKGAAKDATSAIALSYDDTSDMAPIISAKGHHEMAQEIIAVAKEYGVPVVHRSELVEALAAIDLDEPIPEHLYKAVAMILNELHNDSSE